MTTKESTSNVRQSDLFYKSNKPYQLY